jgi:DNA polymerase III alpha subunit (gram-positive type)
VAHNTNFDLKFLPNVIKSKIENQQYSVFCTMQQNRDITPNNKAPKLIEACEIYGIEFDESEAHSSDYDTLKAYELFVKTMIKSEWK